jgi:hypothetical protein
VGGYFLEHFFWGVGAGIAAMLAIQIALRPDKKSHPPEVRLTNATATWSKAKPVSEEAMWPKPWSEESPGKRGYAPMTFTAEPKRDPQNETPVATATPSRDFESRLRTLGALRDAGTITEEEYAAKRKSIIDAL